MDGARPTYRDARPQRWRGGLTPPPRNPLLKKREKVKSCLYVGFVLSNAMPTHETGADSPETPSERRPAERHRPRAAWLEREPSRAALRLPPQDSPL